MPTIKNLLSKISGTDGIDTDVLAKIQAESDRLEAAAYDAKQQSSSQGQKTTALEAALRSVAASVGIEGDTDQIVGEVANKVSAIAKGFNDLSSTKEALESRTAEAEAKATKLERGEKLREYAGVSGANPAVFAELLGDRFDDIKVEGEAVMVGDKTLTDYVEGDSRLKLFKASLFSSDSPTLPVTNPKVPSATPKGSPKGTAPVEHDFVAEAMKRMRFVRP